MKKLFTCLLLAMALAGSALAMEVPTETVVQNLNGSQQLIKTYTLPADADPQILIEEPFEQEGFLYTFAEVVKEENRVEDTRSHTETVTVETSTNDLSAILEQLDPVMEYDDGTWSGTLALDHTSLHTEASGYTTHTGTVTATRTIGPVDRNDMSYVPATTVKNGVTLTLANVEWQVTGTDLVGDALAPTSYQAVATYTGKSNYRTATGYITTADYAGEVTHSGVESVTYRLTYLGELVAEQEGTTNPALETVSKVLPYVLGGVGTAAIVVLIILLVRSRRELSQFQDEEESESEDESNEHEMAQKPL